MNSLEIINKATKSVEKIKSAKLTYDSFTTELNKIEGYMDALRELLDSVTDESELELISAFFDSIGKFLSQLSELVS